MRSGHYSSAPKNRLTSLGFRAVSVVTLAALGAVMIPLAAQAAPSVSQGEGRLLTASILGVSSAPLLALDGADAVNPLGLGDVVADVPLDATALGALGLTVAPGVNLFGSPGIIQLGAVGQYAGANDDGSSVAFSGTVSEASSLIGVSTVTTGSNVGTPGAGDSATIGVNTAQLLGGANLVDLTVGVGAVAASAQQPISGAPTGDYTVSNLDVTVGGTLVGGTITSLDAVVAPLIASVNLLGGTPIVDPLAGGQITVTLADLLAVAGVANVDALPPGTNLLTYLPAAVTAELTSIVNTLLTTLQTEITNAGVLGLALLPALATVQAAVVPILSGLSTTLAGPLGSAVNALLQLNVNNQATNPDGSFTQNALTVGLGTAGALASVRLANATVGPNLGPTGIPPTLTSLTPDRGPETGNTLVTITGSGFTGATGVTFDGLSGTTVTVVNDTTITVRTPAHAPATVNVLVQHPNGASNPGSFTYLPLVAVTQIAPDFGPEAGGTTVTITGACLAGASGVLFDGVAGTAFSETGGVITVTTPAHAPGFVDVTIQGAPGCGTLVVPDGFQYISASAPVITAITPNTGPQTGGTPVTITGTGFTGATAVTFDGSTGTTFTVVSDTQITVTSPAHAPGLARVVVQHPNGPSAPFGFTYTPVTTILGVTPPTGPESGGTAVTIIGSCFTGATAVFFGASAAASFTVVSDTVITATTSSGVGTVDVRVVGSPACGTATDDDGFRYIPVLAVTGQSVAGALLIAVQLLLVGLVILLAREVVARRRMA